MVEVITVFAGVGVAVGVITEIVVPLTEHGIELIKSVL